jgi:hypothetical protein
MTLSVGSKLGPYEILAPIGAGGMGDRIELWGRSPFISLAAMRS